MVFFFSALDDNLKKKKWRSFLGICQYYVFDVSCLMGRVVVNACEMIYLQRVSENHDKSGHRNPKYCLTCPDQGNCSSSERRQFSRERVDDFMKMYSSATLVLGASKRILESNVTVM